MSKVLKDLKGNEYKQEGPQDSVRQFVSEIFKVVITALVIIIPIRYYVIQPFYVKGISMESNFHEGDYLIIDEITYRLQEPRRGDVVVLRPPNDGTDYYLKRIVGLPGEKIQIKDGKVYVIDKENQSQKLDEWYLDDDTFTAEGSSMENGIIQVGENEYFALGDNREHSTDSRYFGVIQRDALVGRAVFRGWPFEAFGVLHNPYEQNINAYGNNS